MNPTENAHIIPGFRLVTSPNIEPFPGADVTALDLAERHTPPKNAPDWLILQAETTGTTAVMESPDGTTTALQSNADTALSVLFLPIYLPSNNRHGLMCWIADQPFMFDLGDNETILHSINERNERLNLTAEPKKLPMFLQHSVRRGEASPTKPPELIVSADTYNVLTSQEIMVLERSAANGRRGQFWKAHPKARKLVYEEKGASHRVELALPEAEQYEDDAIVEAKMKTLGKFIQNQDADFVFALFYVCRLLAPPAPLPVNATALGWIDLEDVAEKIGWNPSKRSRAERAVMREQVWEFIKYGDRAIVAGDRTVPYFDKSGETIPTRIESAVWRIMDKQRPEQTELFGETPQRVQIAIGKQWEPLLTHSRIVQYLPLGELLGSISANQVAGSWARVIGLVLAGIWRRKPRETVNKTLRVPRRELLTTYTPKKKTVEELLESADPRRAVEYWRDALGKLLELDVIAREGEPTRTIADMMKPYEGSYGWQKTWLDEEVLIVPGPKFMPSVEQCAAELPPLQPKALPGAKRRGRPRKKHEIEG